MTRNEYRDLIRELPCFNCGDTRHGYVSWHHLTCLGSRGMGKKAPHYFTIPVCHKCHSKCHSFEISKGEQKVALIQTWIELLSGTYGTNSSYAIIGKAIEHEL